MVIDLDDIVIHFASYPKHICHVKSVLNHLFAHGLYVKAEKCKFHKMKLSFLGFWIGPSEVDKEVSKVAAMTVWPEPTTVKELQRFL